MFKKIGTVVAVLAMSSSIALASATPYVGASLGLVNINGNEGTQGYRGATGNVAVGYGGAICPGLYLAGEIFAIPTSASISGTNALKTSWGVGASILPGMMFTDKTIAYTRVGVIDSEFSTANDNRAGAQLGLGMQTTICQNWDVRGEYVYTKYNSVRSISSPNSDAFNVGLVYKFI